MTGAIPFPDISPEIFSISFFGMDFALRWYALAYIVGIVIGWRLVVMAARRPHLWPAGTPAMTPKQIEDLLTWIILGVILGGRLGYVLFYQPEFYLANPGQILMVWQGGMAFHGGLIGVILASWVYTRNQGIPRLSAADAIAIGVPPGLLLGRIANFINAELWGRATDMPWGVAFPGDAAQACGQLSGLCTRHPSQLYEAALEGLLLGAVLLWLVWRRGALKTPGLVCGTFFAGYGIARFAVEFVRQPDAQFIAPGNPLGLAWHVGGYGLTMGQILSLPMILLGVVLILRARRRAPQTA
ncbi:prolipoprotein diacylglyceryl transferase [Aliishimia ponticola]|uniref:Phosphatidylglycerol--prolipoprotein diacylglyceryl transferase n=1 Tax=Aliishimia ponticola TaxID=2499833 RepID=A0A4S4N9M3_9RHOB|nr:prolipoprotein diacylglyceryl transferase [Aliishimia ponticola]THH35954.1 prolipoprotein diacylglyceryl transferase [Aliishimia ponticola]